MLLAGLAPSEFWETRILRRRKSLCFQKAWKSFLLFACFWHSRSDAVVSYTARSNDLTPQHRLEIHSFSFTFVQKCIMMRQLIWRKCTLTRVWSNAQMESLTYRKHLYRSHLDVLPDDRRRRFVSLQQNKTIVCQTKLNFESTPTHSNDDHELLLVTT